MREALLKKLALACARGYRWVFSIAALLVLLVIAYFVFNPPSIKSDVLDLLPRKSKVVQNFRMATKDFKSLDYLFIVFKTKDPENFPIASFEGVADDVSARLKKSGMVEGVEYRLQDYEGTLREMLPYTLLYLSPNELPEVEKRFTDASIRNQVEINRKMISNPASLIAKQVVQYDPFGLIPILKKHFMGKTRRLNVDLSDGYYISKDETSLIMIVRPLKPAQDISFGKKLMKKVRKAIKTSCNDWEKENGESSESLTVEYGGGYPIAQDDADLIKRDALINTITSVVLVMLVFWWAFRKRSALVYGWLPLILGLLLSFAGASIVGVSLNSATAGFGALLIGLGIDFSIVIYGRFIEERNRGVDIEESIARVMGNTGKGVLVGAVTTACTFGAMLLTSFQGMRDVGIFTGLGILFCALSVLALMPAMLYYHHLHKTRKGIEPTFHMRGFGITGLAKIANRHPVCVLLIAAVATLALGLSASRLRLEDNIQNLRSPNNRGVLVSEQVAKTFGASLSYMMAVVDAPNPEDILEKSHLITNALEPYLKDGRVMYADGLSSYLPPKADQEAILKALASDEKGAFSYSRIRSTFVEACRKNSFNPDYFDSYLNTLQKMLKPSGPITYARLSRGPMAPILERFIVKKGKKHFRGVVYLYIPSDFKRAAPEGLVSSIHKIVPEAKVVGINILSRALRKQIKGDALRAFVAGNILVFLVILLDFRNLKMALLSIIPLGVGLIWMLGTLALLGETLNMMNIFVTTLILGIGSDYGIHFVHRYMEDGGKDMNRVIKEIGVPIVIAALTTIAGFGSMSLSSYPGLRSMGYVSLLGTAYCLIATLTVLVAILTLVKKPAKK